MIDVLAISWKIVGHYKHSILVYVEEQEKLIVATTVDPRYKDKFFKLTTKAFVKQLLIGVCTEIVESTEDGPPNKRQHVDDNIATPSTSKVWECMAEILEDSLMMLVLWEELKEW